MKNTMGIALNITLIGESHGPAVGAVIDGLGAGIDVDEKYIKLKMDQRRPKGNTGTGRHEADEVEILSGVFRGKTTGTPLTVMIKNKNTRSSDYEAMRGIARPSHADYTAHCKYGGFEDYRGGGHFSGRVTAALVAAGAIVSKALLDRGIRIGTHIQRCGDVEDRAFISYEEDLRKLENGFPMLCDEAASAAEEQIAAARREGDSLGGILETAVIGLPAGIGEPWFDTVEGMLAHALFSVPGVKGVEFGAGFGIASMKGSQANDPMEIREGKAVALTNNSGGINGGITNGMPVIFRTAVKPTPSIYKEQKTINFETGQNVDLKIEGRHDPAIVHRARAVVDAVTALTMADLMTAAYGSEYWREKG